MNKRVNGEPKTQTVGAGAVVGLALALALACSEPAGRTFSLSSRSIGLEVSI